jgi:hypothetical protein
MSVADAEVLDADMEGLIIPSSDRAHSDEVKDNIWREEKPVVLG